MAEQTDDGFLAKQREVVVDLRQSTQSSHAAIQSARELLHKFEQYDKAMFASAFEELFRARRLGRRDRRDLGIPVTVCLNTPLCDKASGAVIHLGWTIMN